MLLIAAYPKHTEKIKSLLIYCRLMTNMEKMSINMLDLFPQYGSYGLFEHKHVNFIE